MTNTEANRILDGVKNGIPTPQNQILLALLVTGDLGLHERLRGKRLDQALPGESQRDWAERSAVLVGENHISNH